MQAARNYTADAAYWVEQALGRMPAVSAVVTRPLPVTHQEIAIYVENLLTDEERRTCDMSTD